MDWNTFQKQSDALHKKLNNTHVEYYKFWKDNILFTWRWWLVAILMVSSLLIWLLFRKKESTDRLLYAGFFVMIVAFVLDVIGIGIGLWCYPIYVFPFMSVRFSYDIFVLPVVTMLYIQYFPNVSPYIKAVIYSITSSFIFDPLNVWLGLFEQIHWKYYYSVPIMIFIYLSANYLASRNRFDSLI